MMFPALTVTSLCSQQERIWRTNPAVYTNLSLLHAYVEARYLYILVYLYALTSISPVSTVLKTSQVEWNASIDDNIHTAQFGTLGFISESQ